MNNLVGIIRTFEGLRLKSYLCPAGVWTIGYGSTGPGIGPGLVWSREQAETRMLYDAKKYLGVAKTLCPKADGYRLEALASFAYNLGGTRLAGSTLRRHTNHGDFEKAAEEFNKWVYAGGVKLAGLVLRREVERSIFMKGGD